MNTTCKICGKSFESVGGLHGHLSKVEKIRQREYYEKYFPRFDIFNGNLIPFRSFDSYWTSEFADKKTEFMYLKNSKFNEKSKEILSRQLFDCFSKGTNRFPYYCEWRSSKNIRYDHLLKHGLLEHFIALAKSIGAKFNFNYLSTDVNVLKKESKILIDTREQKPIFDGEKTTINVGDYTLSKEDYNGIHVDRKSKADFIGTFTSGFERFKKECEKAKSMDIYLVVLVEESFSECFNYRPLKYTKQIVTGESAFNGVRRITRQFDNVQFLFVKDRKEAAHYIRLVLNNKEIVKNNDLQFLYELGVI